MAILRQFFLGAIVIAGTLAIWLAYVPSAATWVAGTGLLDALGIELTDTTPPPPEARRSGGGATQVITAAVTQGTLNDRITAVGDGRALRSVIVRSEATGRIIEIAFDAGSYVQEGAVMVRLDDEAEQIALERARLTLTDARDEVDRLSSLQNSGAVTTVQIRTAELALRNAELEIRQAEFDLAQRVIRAPISGWIGLFEVDQGDRIPAQAELATMTDRSQLLIDFRVPERVIGQLKPGMTVELSPLANRGQVLIGTVATLDNVVDRSSRTLRVQARIDNGDDTLREGMAFSVVLHFAGEQYPSINPLSVQWSSEGSFVWVVREGRAERVPIVIRQRNSDSVLVEAELTPGEQVVTEGVQSLRPGTEVEIAKDQAENRASADATNRRRG
ncbi:efflux RND transporter periplasmic adaptor subunit [Puniceibacterium sediminis]|uniref:RND family efflux transporter, MFP subunit n=1 Tax=Puniceibacterium sediminis TaxID=1608407 RepID=A0A238UT56_9RHOB|nr:efflux RND transporter periplasmic adaptor subunit [Puniceibacterium sediminis]SNR24539.1 RND family efflux transporter, MFP subunit [Puniceibacterium sediminis]